MAENGGPHAITLRPGVPGDAGRLSELALRSKGHWGYDAAFLEQCRAELMIDASEVGVRRVTVAIDRAGRPVGFSTLEGQPPEGELGMLFVERDHIGTGVGRLLWSDLVRRAVALGFKVVRIQADPSAAPFYEAMGAVVIGSSPSGSVAGRALPVLAFHLPATDPGRPGGTVC